jgi:IrrE N-terminal-like domain
MTNDLMRAEKRRAYSWADSLHPMASQNALPVDLFDVARRRRVIRAGFRLMVQRGVLVPVPGGFELFLRDLQPRDLEIEGEEPQGALSPRQRFSFAHELAHTHFYVASDGVPTVRKIRINPQELEVICDGVAARILVPADLLNREIRQELAGNYERIDADFVREMAEKFRASHDVVINRLRVVGSENAFARCILLVRRSNGVAQMRACYMGQTLLSSLPAQKIYDPVANWFQEFPRAITEGDGGGRWHVNRRGRHLEIEKIPLGRSGDFLLQIDDPSHRAPTSR